MFIKSLLNANSVMSLFEDKLGCVKPRLDKEQYDHRERVHNSWSGHRGIDATIAMLKED